MFYEFKFIFLNKPYNKSDFKYIIFKNYFPTSQKTQYLRCESMSIDVKEVIHFYRIMRKT
jgi:hypothetical protein